MQKNNRPVLLVLDFINDITHKEGRVPSCAHYVEEARVLDFVNKAIHLARVKKIPILFVKLGFNADYREHPTHSPMFSKALAHNALKLGEWGTEFHSSLDYKINDIVLIKHRVSPFYGTAMELYLKIFQANTLIITGVSTNNAVQAAARDAHDRDYNVLVVEDACGAANVQDHEYAIHLIKRFAEAIKVEQLDTLL